jgi:hypothetical protein
MLKCNDFCEICETPAGLRVWGDPAGALAPRRLPGTPAERERISQKSTLYINTAFILNDLDLILLIQVTQTNHLFERGHHQNRFLLRHTQDAGYLPYPSEY